MGKYRKRPVVIEAVQMGRPFSVQTLEGEMKGDSGDWLITGVENEQYPCKPGIFAKTYEAVTETPVLAFILKQRKSAFAFVAMVFMLLPLLGIDPKTIQLVQTAVLGFLTIALGGSVGYDAVKGIAKVRP